MMLTAEQRREFDQVGVLHLPGAVSKSDAAQMSELVWATLAQRHGIQRDAPETWSAGGAYGIQPASKSEAFARMASPVVRAALDDLFEPSGWEQPRNWGAPLVTFPVPGNLWDVPHASWHLDAPVQSSAPRPPCVIVFLYLAPVLERGGGTVVLAGSHRLASTFFSNGDTDREWRSADVRKVLARTEPWLSALWSRDDRDERVNRFMRDCAEIRGVRLNVIELTGNVGDVIIWHPWLLHAAAPNCRAYPRMMLRQPIYPARGLR